MFLFRERIVNLDSKEEFCVSSLNERQQKFLIFWGMGGSCPSHLTGEKSQKFWRKKRNRIPHPNWQIDFPLGAYGREMVENPNTLII
jgi:hypothetical protein